MSEACFLRAHSCRHVDIEFRCQSSLCDKRLAVEHTNGAVALAHHIEPRVDGYRTPLADLRCSVEEAGKDARAIPAVTAVEGPLKRLGMEMGSDTG